MKTISTIRKRRDRQSIPKAGFTPAISGVSTSTDIGRVQGRRKDMIIRGGENIYPREIEDVLYTHPAVMGASIVGVPDRDWGEVPVGFVQIKPGHEVAEQELSEFCRVRLASYKVPRIWRFVDQFPQTASSKVQKYVLRELYLAEKGPLTH